jgi:hypothetical protein
MSQPGVIFDVNIVQQLQNLMDSPTGATVDQLKVLSV